MEPVSPRAGRTGHWPLPRRSDNKASRCRGCQLISGAARSHMWPDPRYRLCSTLLQGLPQNARLLADRGYDAGVGIRAFVAERGASAAAGLYVVSHHTVQSGLIDLETFCRMCREKSVPSHRRWRRRRPPHRLPQGRCRSGHHQHAEGLGRLHCGDHLWPNGSRACMLSKRQGCLPAYEGWQGQRHRDDCCAGALAEMIAQPRWALLERCKALLSDLPRINVEVELGGTSKLFSRLLLHIDPARAGITASELAKALWDQRPSIFVRSLMADIGLLQIDLRRRRSHLPHRHKHRAGGRPARIGQSVAVLPRHTGVIPRFEHQSCYRRQSDGPDRQGFLQLHRVPPRVAFRTTKTIIAAPAPTLVEVRSAVNCRPHWQNQTPERVWHS